MPQVPLTKRYMTMIRTQSFRWATAFTVAAAGMLAHAAPAAAQLDPLLFLKGSQPNVIVAVDTANRMQRDAPSDPGSAQATSSYYDPYVYSASLITGLQQTELGLASGTTTYRRKYVGLQYTSNGSGDKFLASTIAGVGNAASSYSLFEASTRLAVARAALDQAIKLNQNVVRFGLIKMRQNAPTIATNLNSGPVNDSDPGQTVGDIPGTGAWNISRPTVSGNNGSVATSAGSILVQADAASANTTILTTLAKDVRTAGALLTAGNDDANTNDQPVKLMLDDARTEAARLIAADSLCRNTVVVLIVGGGEGNTNTTAAALQSAASGFLNVSARRV